MTEPLDMDDVLWRFDELAEQQRSAWQATVCKGEAANLSLCTDPVAAVCPMRRMLDCPRRLRTDKARQRAELRAEALSRGIPERVLQVVFDRAPERKPIMAEVERFMRSKASVLLLCEQPNSGKTTAAGWACLPPAEAPWTPAFRRKRVPAGRFVQMADLAGPQGRLLLEDLQRYDLMAIDDIGASYFGESGFQVSILGNVVDHAYLACKKLILTTDLGRPALVKLLGGRLLAHIDRAGSMS